MLTRFNARILVSLAAFAASLVTALPADNPFLGYWELTLPGGRAGWLGVEQTPDGLKASLLWGGGSVLPTTSATLQDSRLLLTRQHQVRRKDASGKTLTTNITETITATLDGDTINCLSIQPRDSGTGEDKTEFSGRRTPPLPPAPDLGKIKFGQPIPLFNGQDLAGWRLTQPTAVNGWSVKDGILANNPAQPEGQPHKNYGNLRTDREFHDFNLKLQARVPEHGNSGVYLRGIYEVQVCDSYGKPLDPHNMGAIYSRIRPTVTAEKPPGEWQTLDITLVNRHVTVVLNGKPIIDNQALLGCTGGALWSDVSRPGPIYLQGDHTGIEYRDIVLRPVAK